MSYTPDLDPSFSIEVESTCLSFLGVPQAVLMFLCSNHSAMLAGLNPAAIKQQVGCLPTFYIKKQNDGPNLRGQWIKTYYVNYFQHASLWDVFVRVMKRVKVKNKQNKKD